MKRSTPRSASMSDLTRGDRAESRSHAPHRLSTVPPYVVAATSSYEMACVAAVVGLLLAVAIAAGW